MGNIGGGEVLVILMLGLLVLGPARLAVVARRVGSMTRARCVGWRGPSRRRSGSWSRTRPSRPWPGSVAGGSPNRPRRTRSGQRGQTVPDSDAQMPLVEHLEELRRRLILAVAAIAVGAVACWILYPQILELLLQPYCQIRGSGSVSNAFGRWLRAARHGPPRAVRREDDGGRLRRGGARHACPALAGLAVRGSRSAGRGASLGDPLRGGRRAAVRHGVRAGLLEHPAGPRLPDRDRRPRTWSASSPHPSTWDSSSR